MEKSKRTTMTIRELLAAVDGLDLDTPITVRTPDGDWWLNVISVSDPRQTEEPSVILATRDDFDTRQW